MGVSFSCALDQVMNHVCSCLGGEVNYICNLDKNLAALERAIEVLRAKRADVLTKVHREERQGLQRLNEVQVMSLWSLYYSYGKKVFEMLKEVEDLKSDGVFEVVAGPRTKDVVVEMSLQPTIIGQDIMIERAWNHLIDEGTGIMGLYGMGGVGKTTLLAQINNRFLGTNDGFEIVIWVVVSRELRVD
ncbi:unnamed protein product [Microthlaspi erraticum]|uniref:NB-ARC domain-containing protein n=1 Tax=Microthlaspi erraticum TaxID=1685480 RepID=A0A6D2KBL1_9BRAS|nr:unnamed protein product [Microthlaspi erraticum]CAA7054382.1 unnamed protein product [Microthlaspi erraticum]